MAAPLSVYSATTWEDRFGCFNQVINHGNFDATSGWTNYTPNAPYSIDSDGVCTMTVNTAVRNPMVTRTFTSIAAGHKVYASLWLKITSSTNVPFLPLFIYSPTTYLTTAQQSNNYANWTHVSGIIDTGSAAKTRVYVGAMGVASTDKFPVGAKIQVKNVWMADLTAMYGAGNEPTKADMDERYSNEYYPYKEVVTTNPTNTQIYCRLPLQLSSYTNDNTFKSKFYCDHVMPVMDDAGHYCVLGLVRADQTNGVYTENYKHHGVARHGKLYTMYQRNPYIILNDGGLNTTPHIQRNSSAVNTHIPMQYANYIQVKANLTGAYYVDGNMFHADVYKVRGQQENYVDGAYFMPTEGQVEYPAQFAQNGVATFIKPSTGISAGDTVRVKLSAINSEGTFENATTTDFTALDPVNFTQVYRFASQPNWTTTNPTSGAHYLMAIDQSRYGANGTFTRLFALDSGDWLDLGLETGGEWLRGMSGDPGSQESAVMGNLAQGYYYGVPTTWGGSTFRYVQIANGANNNTSTRRLAWFASNYSTTSYNLAISFSGIHHVLTDTYTITVNASLSGTWSGSISVTVPVYTIARTPVFVRNVTGSGNTANFTVGSFTYSGEDDLWSIGSTGTPAANAVTEGSIVLRNIPDDNI